MAQQTINIGATPNDFTGDPLRVAFDKINDNFDELYPLAPTADQKAALAGASGTPSASNRYVLADHANSTFWKTSGTTTLTGATVINNNGNTLTFNNQPIFSAGIGGSIIGVSQFHLPDSSPLTNYFHIRNATSGNPEAEFLVHNTTSQPEITLATKQNNTNNNSRASVQIRSSSGSSGSFQVLAYNSSGTQISSFIIGGSAVLRWDIGSDATGDIYQRNSSGNIQRLAAVATGNVLISGGVGTVSSWGKVGLTTHVSGTLPVANGGTGATTFTASRLLIGDGANAITTDSTLTFDTTNDILTVGLLTINSRGTNNTFTGQLSGNTTLSGAANTGYGAASLFALTSGGGNSMFGQAAGVAITSGVNNTGIGSLALTTLSTGSNNTAIGASALQLVTGSQNIAIGSSAGNAMTTGSQNIVIGYDIDAQSNTANGQLTIANAIFGTGNTGTGTSVSTGNIGVYVVSPSARLHLPAGTATANTAPLKLTTGTALGTPEDGAIEYHSSHLYFTIGSTRYQLDQQGGISGLTTNRITYATSATTLGDDAALTWDATNNAITINGVRIHSIGTTGNIFIGGTSGNFTNTGERNIGLGSGVMADLTVGQANTVIGNASAPNFTNASNNVVIGNQSLTNASATSVSGNVIIGASCGNSITSGSSNTIVGSQSATNLTSGTSNIIIGFSLDAQSATANNQLSIQNIIFGENNSGTGTTISTGSIGIGVATSLAARLQVRGVNNATALLVEDDGGNDILSVGESGGARVVGFFGVTPVIRQVVPTGSTADQIITALQNLGLFSQT